MKIYRGLSSIAKYYPFDEHLVRLVGPDYLSDQLLLENSTVTFDSYDLKVRGEDIQVKDTWYRFQRSVSCSNNAEAFAQNECAYVDRNGEPLTLQPEILALLSGQGTRVPDEFFARKGLWRNLQIVHCSVTENAYSTTAVAKGTALTHLPPYLLCLNRGERHMFCLDHNFQQQWLLKDEVNYVTNLRNIEINQPTPYADGFVINHGASKVDSAHFIDREGKEKPIDVYLVCDLRRYRAADGAIIWQHDFQGEIQQYQIVDDSMFLASNNTLFKLSAETGEVLYSMDSGCSAVFDRGNFGNTLYAVGDYVFFGHASDRKFHIYSSSDLSLLRDVPMPEKWHIFPKSLPYFHQPTNKLYLQASLFDNVWMEQALLEIDLGDITSAIEVETGPQFDIELVASADQQGQQEISIRTSEPDLDLMFRFAELYVRDQAFKHGTSATGGATYTEGFNGVVQFHYAPKSTTKAETKPKLKMMEKRFASWAETYAMKSADGSVNCALRATLHTA